MSNLRHRGSSQQELFPRSKRPTIPIENNHRLVRIANKLDWTELEFAAESIRASKLKNGAGRSSACFFGEVILRRLRRDPC